MSKQNKIAKLNKLKMKYSLIIVALMILIFALYALRPTFMKYYSEVTAQAIGYAKETHSDSYTVKFYSNGGTGTMEDQTIKYNVPTSLKPNTFEKEEHSFNGWNTEEDGTGTSYSDEETINNTTEETINLYAQWVQGVAEVNGEHYNSLQEAITNGVPSNGTETVVKLLRNTSETIIIPNGKNIIFNLQNYTVSNSGGGAVITNNGTIKISNGNIITTSTTNAAINNNATGKITISGGRVIMQGTGGKQALYNDKGTVEITGDAYLSSVSTIRATVQNQASGTMNITGGTIIATGFQAVTNNGTMNIGTKDATIDKSSPVIQGVTYGVSSSTDFNFYDGIIKGKTNGFNDETKIVDKENGYDIAHSEEVINGENYKTAYLAITNTVTFNANGGTVSENTRKIETGNKIGTLPKPTRDKYSFEGWFTLEEGGEKISADQVITADVTYYAHWIRATAAEINGTEYDTLQKAIDAVQLDGVETTIKLLRDVSENVKVIAGQNIVFNLQDFTLYIKQ